MTFDGIVTRTITNELKNTIIGGKISKIYQTEKDELLLHIYNKGIDHKLNISASSNNPRINFTSINKPNPEVPPMFCMVLRKHILGGKILDINQYKLDRIIIFDIKSYDEMGQITIKQLIVEIMGKHSNIILVDKETNKVIDSIKRVPENISRVRQILPGKTYVFPPTQNKLNPLDVDEKSFLNRLESTNNNVSTYKFLYKNFLGYSPLIGKEIVNNANISLDSPLEYLSNEDKKRLYNEFNNINLKIKTNDFKPNIIKYKDSNEIIEFHALYLKQFNNLNIEYIPSMSQVLEKYYAEKDMLDRIHQKSASIRKLIQTKLERAQNKLYKQTEELSEADKRDLYKTYGDLITSNLYKIGKGQNSIIVENFYSDNMEKINIPLDIRLEPIQNAQKYYKRYSKLKNAYLLINAQIKETKEEINYFENILVNINNCTAIDELEEIKEELVEQGYIKNRSKKKEKRKKTISTPHHYKSSDGYSIYVGKNNKQNDYLTIKYAKKNDIWLHVKNMPGSHVIIKNNDDKDVIPNSTLQEAALLAAYYSKGRNSENVPVDYTIKKYVKKPNGAKPGYVIYENNNTIYVTPKKEIINKIDKVK